MLEYKKNQLFKDEESKDLVCLDTTEDYAFLCPIDLEKGIIDTTNIACYSTKTGDTPIVQIELAKKEGESNE